MLKIATEAEEQRGSDLMIWWDGDGAARVLGRDGNALLLERSTGAQSLTEMAGSGNDDEASRILCAVAARLHARRDLPPPQLVPLPRWFEALAPAAQTHGGVLRLASKTAHDLLRTPQDSVALHGDIHHANVLDFGPRGLLAIDPKGLIGERGFDFANIFCNPDFETATQPGRLARQATIVAVPRSPAIAAMDSRLRRTFGGLDHRRRRRSSTAARDRRSHGGGAERNRLRSVSRLVRPAVRAADTAPRRTHRPIGTVRGADTAADRCRTYSETPAGSHSSGQSSGNRARRGQAAAKADGGARP